MGKKHKHPEHENLERWLVSYADFITLLFATFTALYAMTFSELQKIQTSKAEALTEGFKSQSLFYGFESLLKGRALTNAKANPVATDTGAGDGIMGGYQQVKPFKIDPELADNGTSATDKQAFKDLAQEVAKLNEDMAQLAEVKAMAQVPEGQKGAFSETDAQGFKPLPISVSLQERGVRISFDSRILFNSGSAALSPYVSKLLAKMAQHLRTLAQAHLIHVEGHTDNLPIRSLQFPSNWELSGARASSVVRYLIQQQRLPASKLAAVGYADTHPVASNTTLWGRTKNRRIDIIILTAEETRDEDPTYQARSEVPLKVTLTQAKKAFPLGQQASESATPRITESTHTLPTNPKPREDKPKTPLSQASSSQTPASPAEDAYRIPIYNQSDPESASDTPPSNPEKNLPLTETHSGGGKAKNTPSGRGVEVEYFHSKP